MLLLQVLQTLPMLEILEIQEETITRERTITYNSAKIGLPNNKCSLVYLYTITM